MTSSRLDRLAAAHQDMVFGAAMLAVVALGIMDYLSGPELAFSAFYLLPVAAVGWASRLAPVIAVSAVAAGTWLAADVASGEDYSNAFVPAWNATTRLVTFLAVGALLSRLQVAIGRERRFARVDHLTGVPNSRWFAHELESHFAAMTTGTLTLLYIDLDDFKAINDRHGHSGGDDVLRQAGQALADAVRAGDVVGRVGGDEFAMLVRRAAGVDPRSATEAIVDRVRRTLARLPEPVTFSAGAVSFTSRPADIDAAIVAADMLMYEVKRSSKGGFAHEIVSDPSASSSRPAVRQERPAP